MGHKVLQNGITVYFGMGYLLAQEQSDGYTIFPALVTNEDTRTPGFHITHWAPLDGLAVMDMEILIKLIGVCVGFGEMTHTEADRLIGKIDQVMLERLNESP